VLRSLCAEGRVGGVCAVSRLALPHLRQRRCDVALFARRCDQVDCAVAKRFEILIPIGETRGHDNGNVAGFRLRRRQKIEVRAIREMPFAENHANTLAGQ